MLFENADLCAEAMTPSGVELGLECGLPSSLLSKHEAPPDVILVLLRRRIRPAPRGAVRPLDIGPDGSVWVGTSDGVRHFKRGGGYEDFKAANSPLANNELRAVCVDRATGVVWFGTASGINRYDPNYVAPTPPAISALQMTLYPNPLSLTRMGLELRLRGNTTAYRGEILDLGGRVVRTFAVGANDRVIWDGRDANGKLVQPGVYFVHARGGGREGIARAVVLR